MQNGAFHGKFFLYAIIYQCMCYIYIAAGNINV